jgi:hypothetical protein
MVAKIYRAMKLHAKDYDCTIKFMTAGGDKVEGGLLQPQLLVSLGYLWKRLSLTGTIWAQPGEWYFRYPSLGMTIRLN